MLFRLNLLLAQLQVEKYHRMSQANTAIPIEIELNRKTKNTVKNPSLTMHTIKTLKIETETADILYILTSVLTAMDFTVRPANLLFLLLFDHFGIKTKSLKSSSTINPFNNRQRRTKDIKKNAPIAIKMNDRYHCQINHLISL